jgi:adenosylcobinamide kinase/adenosylcobinamide-phosphate guanylyltransferase
MLTLVIGGARSGKSRFAQSLAEGSRKAAYIATSRAEDEEMAARIARHREERPAHWLTVEEPLEIGAALERCAPDCEVAVLDCLTVWLSNLSWEHRESGADCLREAAAREVARLARAAAGTHLVAVSNELGCGLVPESAVARMFRDVHGWMNQDVARAADQVYHVVAGIAVPIKQPGGAR